jgi:hypothetical protein
VLRLRTPSGEWGAPHIPVGEAGRGRKLVRVPLPEGAKVSWSSTPEPSVTEWWGTLVTAPGPGTVILFRDHSGYRGTWTLSIPPSAVIIADGWCAQGIAGRMGGGPEYVIRAPEGAEFKITRSGRLYGAPADLRVRVHADRVEVADAAAEADSAEAAARWGVEP